MNKIQKALQDEKKIKVEGYVGFWSVIDDYEDYLLLEHNTYGDETCSLVIKPEEDNVIWQEYFSQKIGIRYVVPTYKGEVFETYDDIETCLQDEGIL